MLTKGITERRVAEIRQIELDGAQAEQCENEVASLQKDLGRLEARILDYKRLGADRYEVANPMQLPWDPHVVLEPFRSIETGTQLARKAEKEKAGLLARISALEAERDELTKRWQ
jgi:hypothetical protein